MTHPGTLHKVAAWLLSLATILLLIRMTAHPATPAAPLRVAVAEALTPQTAEPQTLLGIDPDTTETMVITTSVSLLLAAALTRWGTANVEAATAGVALFLAVLDWQAFASQSIAAHPPWAALALVAALLHLGVAAVAGLAYAWRSSCDDTVRRRYARSARHEQDWLGSLANLESPQHPPGGTAHHRPMGQNGHRGPRER